MPSLRSLRTDYLRLSPAEGRLWRWPIMWLSAAAIVAVPPLYATLSLGSALDPYGRLDTLPVALVNLDQGALRGGLRRDLGAEVVRGLTRAPQFRYLTYPSEQSAQDAVRRGAASFALTIPESFSRRALAGRSTEHGTLNVYVTEGGNYFASRVARAFAATLAGDLNRTLGETRWEIVQTALNDVETDFAQIRTAAARLADDAATLKGGARQLQFGASDLAGGARRASSSGAELATGAGQLAGSVIRVTDSAGKLTSGLRQLEDTVPGRSELAPLRTGAAQLAVGVDGLAGNLTTLSVGAGRLGTGVAATNAGAQTLSGVSARLAGQAAPLQSGAEPLAAAARRLAAAARAANTRARALETGAQQVAVRLPALQTTLGQLAGSAAGLSASAQAVTGSARRLSGSGAQVVGQLGQLQGGLEGARQGAVRANATAANFAQMTAQMHSSLQSQILVPAQVREDVSALRNRALQLQGGTSTLNVALPRFSTSARQTAVAARQVQTGAAGLAGNAGRLDSGAQALAGRLSAAQAGAAASVRGARTVGAGAGQLASGAAELAAGASALAAQLGAFQITGLQSAGQSGAGQLRTDAARLAAGTRQLQASSSQVAGRATAAAREARALQGGARTVQGGVGQLVGSTLTLKSSLGQLAGQLPAPSDLRALKAGASTLSQQSAGLGRSLSTVAGGADRLKRGAEGVNQGAGRLLGGLNDLQARMPTSVVAQVSRDPATLGVSVRPDIQTFAAVRHGGAALAPSTVALSLWVGVILTTFIFPFSQLPRSGRRTSQLSRVLRKASVPALLVVAQALLVVWGVHALGVDFLHPAQVLLTAALSSLSFLALVLALIFLCGATGRLLAVVLLVIQLAAAGGSSPVELAPRAVQIIHEWLPVTQSAGALRYALSGALQGGYAGFMLSLLGIAAVSVALGLLGRERWEFVDDGDFRPLISAPMTSRGVPPDPYIDASTGRELPERTVNS